MQMMPQRNDLYIGLMSGTSMDAIDTALVSFENNKIQLIATHSISIPSEIKSALATLMLSEHIHLKLLGQTDTQLGELFSDAVLALLKKTKMKTENIAAIGSHGQTIYHAPNEQYPFTMQIGDPNIIAARTNITTVADFRRRDIASGGQGAPLVPAFHEYLLRDQESGIRNQFVLNLGGIANITYLPADKTKFIIGFDTGPANTLLDQWCEKQCGKSFDENGAWARLGKCIPELLSQLLVDPYFHKSCPKSTGREYFNLEWLDKKLQLLSTPLQAKDIQATLTELTAKTITDAITATVTDTVTDTLWICGGGAYNSFLIERLQYHSPHLKIKSTAEIGIDPKWIEAAAFAWLAKQTMEHKPGNLPSVTGAKSESILGGVYYS